MPRRKPTLPESEIELEFPTSQEVAASVKPDEFGEKPKRNTKARLGVFLPFTEDGSIDTARLKGEDWKLDAARKALGASGGEVKQAGMEVSEDFVRGLYGAFELSIQKVGTLFLKWPRDLASLMKYSDESKNKLVPPTKAVIEKLAPSWLIKHQEIATLAVVLASETQNMVQEALQKYIQLHPEVLSPVKPNGHAVTSENRPVPTEPLQ